MPAIIGRPSTHGDKSESPAARNASSYPNRRHQCPYLLPGGAGGFACQLPCDDERSEFLSHAKDIGNTTRVVKVAKTFVPLEDYPPEFRKTNQHSFFMRESNGQSASASDDRTVRIWPLWTAAADYLCTRVWRNLSMEEWRFYIGEGIPYERTCPSLPPGTGAPK